MERREGSWGRGNGGKKVGGGKGAEEVMNEGTCPSCGVIWTLRGTRFSDSPLPAEVGVRAPAGGLLGPRGLRHCDSFASDDTRPGKAFEWPSSACATENGKSLQTYTPLRLNRISTHIII